MSTSMAHHAPTTTRHGETWRRVALGIAIGIALEALTNDPRSGLGALVGFAICSRITLPPQWERMVPFVGGALVLILLSSEHQLGGPHLAVLGLLAGLPAGACLAGALTLRRGGLASPAPRFVRWWLLAPGVVLLAHVHLLAFALAVPALGWATCRAGSAPVMAARASKPAGLAIALATCAAGVLAIVHALAAAPHSPQLVAALTFAAVITCVAAIVISGLDERWLVVERVLAGAVAVLGAVVVGYHVMRRAEPALVNPWALQLAAFALFAIGLNRALAGAHQGWIKTAMVAPIAAYALLFTLLG